MFAIINIESGNIYHRTDNDQMMIFNSEKAAWKTFLENLSEENQERSKIIRISWVRK